MRGARILLFLSTGGGIIEAWLHTMLVHEDDFVTASSLFGHIHR